MDLHHDKFIDAKGLKCPQPLLLTKNIISKVAAGQVVLLEATDPHTDLDLEVWCERFAYKIIQSAVSNDVYKFWIKK